MNTTFTYKGEKRRVANPLFAVLIWAFIVVLVIVLTPIDIPVKLLGFRGFWYYNDYLSRAVSFDTKGAFQR